MKIFSPYSTISLMSPRKKIIRRKSKKHLITKSFSTTSPDSYEAGLEIGEALSEIEPETVILFSSYHHDMEDLLEGLADGMENPGVILFGGTGDGFFETGDSALHGACALGFNSGGKIRWKLAVRTGAGAEPGGKTRECAQEVLEGLDGSAAMAFVMGHLHCDGVQVAEAAQSVLNVPVIGGLAGDDFSFKKGFVFAGGKFYDDAVAVLGMSGDFSFGMSSASGWKPLGNTGHVDEAVGNTIHAIDGRTPVGFLEQQFGILPAELSMAVIPLAAYEEPGSENYYLRTPVHIDMESGKITYSGNIPAGTEVRVCTAREDDVAGSIRKALDMIGKPGFEPLCAVAISCSSRKLLLKGRIELETSQVFDCMGKTIPLIGFPSFGEIGPFRNPDKSYTPAYFHNVTYVIVLIGI